MFSPTVQHKNTVVHSCLWKPLLVWSKVGQWRPLSCGGKKKKHCNAQPPTLQSLCTWHLNLSLSCLFKNTTLAARRIRTSFSNSMFFAFTLRLHSLFCALEGMCPKSLWPGHGCFLLTHLPWASHATWMDKPYARKLQRQWLKPPICISLNLLARKSQSMAVILR